MMQPDWQNIAFFSHSLESQRMVYFQYYEQRALIFATVYLFGDSNHGRATSVLVLAEPFFIALHVSRNCCLVSDFALLLLSWEWRNAWKIELEHLLFECIDGFGERIQRILPDFEFIEIRF